MNKLSVVEEKLLNDAMRKLMSIPELAFVISGRGVEHKHGNIGEPKRQYKNKGVVKYITPFIKSIAPGSVITIPSTPEFSVGAIQASVSSMLSRTYGKASYATARRADKAIEVLVLNETL